MLDLKALETHVKIHKVTIKALDGDIFVKDLTLTKMETIQKATPETYIRTVLLHTVCDEEGNQYFARVQELNTFIEKMPMPVISEIMSKITEVVFPQKDVEEEAKN